MKKCLILALALLAPTFAWSATWRCSDASTMRVYLSSQSVPSDRCNKTSDADPTDADRERVALDSSQSSSVKALSAMLEKKEVEKATETANELAAAENSTVTCKGKEACRKAFALAQVYVQQRSDQKIQVATDTIIDTYNPTEGGNVGITVTKTPRSGATEIISITPNCKTEGAYYESVCRLKRTIIYRGFRPFIEKSMNM
jgi:hypothetical protein